MEVITRAVTSRRDGAAPAPPGAPALGFPQAGVSEGRSVPDPFISPSFIIGMTSRCYVVAICLLVRPKLRESCLFLLSLIL